LIVHIAQSYESFNQDMAYQGPLWLLHNSAIIQYCPERMKVADRILS